VNSLDFSAVAANFNQTLAAAPGTGLGALVPEPSSIAMLGLIGLVARRRRRV
jgi:hypothetical protein